MLLIIDYPDGTSEALAAELVGGVVSHGRRWIPGILVQEPKQCYFKSDFFEAAMNEGHQRSGEITTDAEDPEFIGFRWKLVGNEADACREKMAHWRARLGSAFDPDVSGGEYLLEGLLRLLSEEDAVQYDRDRECWQTYLDDPASELAGLSRRPGSVRVDRSDRDAHGSGPMYG
jgi:hypothetical protein